MEWKCFYSPLGFLADHATRVCRHPTRCALVLTRGRGLAEQTGGRAETRHSDRIGQRAFVPAIRRTFSPFPFLIEPTFRSLSISPVSVKPRSGAMDGASGSRRSAFGKWEASHDPAEIRLNPDLPCRSCALGIEWRIGPRFSVRRQHARRGEEEILSRNFPTARGGFSGVHADHRPRHVERRCAEIRSSASNGWALEGCDLVQRSWHGRGNAPDCLLLDSTELQIGRGIVFRQKSHGVHGGPKSRSSRFSPRASRCFRAAHGKLFAAVVRRSSPTRPRVQGARPDQIHFMNRSPGSCAIAARPRDWSRTPRPFWPRTAAPPRGRPSWC